MFGFLVTKGKNITPALLKDAKSICCNEVTFLYHPMPKFEQDKLFFEDEQKIVLLDGVIFNKKELLSEYNCDDWKAVFNTIYEKSPTEFFKFLRGSFCGVVYAKTENMLTCFTNQSGEKPVLYTKQPDCFLAASHNNILTQAMKELHIAVEPNLQGCRELLCCASLLHGNTPFAGVRRLIAGKALTVTDEICREYRYHMFRNVPEHELTLEQCVEEMDKRFRKAVDRIFSKNEEYGYQSECDLSGGLDSRMATWVAYDLGYRNFLNVCYCQKGCIDNTTSAKIARDIGNDYFFLPMDGGDILFDIDETVDKFGGQLNFIICTGANRAMKEIAKRNIGMCCTGLLGELHNAYWVEGDSHTPAAYTSNRYSRGIDLTIPEEYSEDYDNFEQMNLYEYSTLLWMSSAIVRQQVCEVTSPFVDVDYLEFAYRVPLKWRKNYLLTMTWMNTKYPQAAKYVWQTKRMPVANVYYGKPYLPKVLDDIRTLAIRCINKALRVTKISKQIAYKQDMNPFDNWFISNPRLSAFMDQYYADNIGLVKDEALRHDIAKTYEQGNGIFKISAANLLAVYKRFFQE